MPNVRSTMRATARMATLCVVSTLARAGDVQIAVLDRDGMPVPEVAVYAVPVDARPEPLVQGGKAHAPNGPHAVEISQSDLAFHPHLSIVETGSEVRFPNNDDVRHHVYSFSDAKRFDLTIDSGSVTSQTFDTAGIVTLGCNIHDGMLAYVLVVDTAHFAKTGGDGLASLTVPAGRYELNVFTPRLPEKALPAPVAVEIEAAGSQSITIRFERKLYPPHEHSDTSLTWSHY
jgi:plastocyanin